MANKWWVLLGTGIMIMLINLDATIVNLALAAIAEDLSISMVKIQWIANSYLISAAIFFVIGGKLTLTYGKRRIFLLGTTLFLVSSLLAGITNNYTLLIIARVIQGIGFAFTLGLAIVMSAETFPDHQKGLAVGISVTLTGVAQAIGPTIGGLILSFLSWHWIFLINIPLCILSYYLTVKHYAADTPSHPDEKLDVIGSILLAICLALILTALNHLADWGVSSWPFILTMTVGLLTIPLFYWYESTIKHPIMYFSILNNRNVSLSIFIRMVFMYSWAGMLMIIPLYLQNILNFSPMRAGVWMLVMSFMLGIVSPIAGRFMDQIGFQKPVALSMLLAAVSFYLLSLCTADHSPRLLGTALFLYGICIGLNIPSTLNGVMVSVPKELSSFAVGIFFTFTFIGSSLGVALSGSHVNWLSNTSIETLISKENLFLNAEQLQNVTQAANGTHNIFHYLDSFSTSQAEVISKSVYLSFIGGFHWLMLSYVALSLVGFLACFGYRAKRV